MSEQRFYVIGGEYADTSFREPFPGTKLETYGPFATEREAKVRWRELTGQSIDNAMVRYFISSDETAGEKRKNYWVVGGEYADSSFTRLASGSELEVYGPFEHGEALGFWRALASKTMDDALIRYDIRENYEAGNGTKLGGARLAPTVTKSIAIAADPAAVFKHLMEMKAGRNISRSDAGTGVIDYTRVDDAGHHWAVAARVVAAGGGAVYVVTFTKPTMVPEAEFTAAMRRVDDELSALKRVLEK
jgi:hypothetical protein